jgi:hypothetical protein
LGTVDVIGDSVRRSINSASRVRMCLLSGCLLLTLGLSRADATVRSGWVIQSTPQPAGSTESSFDAVSCPIATDCEAVGDYVVAGGGEMPLVERWTGTAWSVESVPNPARARNSFLSDVSCISSAACMAVGTSTTGAVNGVSLAERWNGVAWTVEPTPNPARARESSLYGVSCTSPKSCTAVGFYTDRRVHRHTLAEHWDGTRWSIQPTPAPVRDGALESVSCSTKQACTAVGNYFSAGRQTPLAEQWNGIRWSVKATPKLSGLGDALSGVSCTTATECIAVGGDITGSGVAVAEHWDGAGWKLQHTAHYPGTKTSFLTAVSCRSTRACTAVGTYKAASGQMPLALRWNGHSWLVQTIPHPTATSRSFLLGLSCASATACTAAGLSGNRPSMALAEGYAAPDPT